MSINLYTITNIKLNAKLPLNSQINCNWITWELPYIHTYIS